MSIQNAENISQIINYYNDLCVSTYIIISKINANIEHGVRRITKLQADLLVLQNILEKQRMCFVVNYFCSNNTKNAFPKYLLPTLKNKYGKLYNHVILNNNSSKVYFKNGNLIEAL